MELHNALPELEEIALPVHPDELPHRLSPEQLMRQFRLRQLRKTMTAVFGGINGGSAGKWTASRGYGLQQTDYIIGRNFTLRHTSDTPDGEEYWIQQYDFDGNYGMEAFYDFKRIKGTEQNLPNLRGPFAAHCDPRQANYDYEVRRFRNNLVLMNGSVLQLQPMTAEKIARLTSWLKAENPRITT